jgi:hypothetical protein
MRGIYHWRNSTGAVKIGPGRFMRFGKVGSSDILAVLPGGKILCVEVKAPGGRLSPEQRQFLADITALDGVALVVKDWKEIDTALRQGGYISDGPLFEALLAGEDKHGQGFHYAHGRPGINGLDTDGGITGGS